MEIIIVLLPLAILLGAFFVGAFIWATKKGQYDDVETPRFRMLLEDQKINPLTQPSRKDER